MFKKFLFSSVFIFTIILTISAKSYAAITTFYPVADSPTYQAYPNTNYNNRSSSDVLWTGIWWGSSDTRSYLEFDLSSISNTQSATLFLYNLLGTPSAASSYAPAVVNSYLVTGPWTENSITWNNQPGLGTPGGSTTVENCCGWYSWDVTNLAKTTEGSFFSLALTSEGAGHVYGGKDNQCGYSPRLEINTVPEPATISLLGLGLLGLVGFRRKK